MKIAFYKGTRPGVQAIFSTGVRWWTNGPYSHCEAVLRHVPDGVSLCASSSFIDGGVRMKSIQLDADHWDIVDVDGDERAAYAWYKANAGAAYDVLALAGFVFRRGDGSKNKFMCSESVAAALGFPQAWRFDPNALHAILSRCKEIPREEPTPAN